MEILVGCCGFNVKGGQSAYYARFRLVELQSTFYKLPKLSTAEKWRSEAPPHFEFTMKAWQAITHSPKSPTWKRSGLDPKGSGRYGSFKLTKNNLDAWHTTRQIAEKLASSVCVFQSAPSFGYTKENFDCVRRFLLKINRGSLLIGWEPRGTWRDNPARIAEICRKLKIIHVVDLLRSDPAYLEGVAYFRMHGLGGREVNYAHRYTRAELEDLAGRVLSLETRGVKQAYVLFNNVSMAEDAGQFMKLLSKA